MGFSQMVELLQIKNKGKIVMCNAGNFYIAIGKDAILLNNILGLKLTCLKEEICKVGFPIQSLEKYTDLIQQKGYSHIVYFFNQESEELEVLIDYMGSKENPIKENKLILIPKTEKYIEYILQLLLKLPRTEKFSIGTEYKRAMYEMTENILIISKVGNKDILNYLNKIDASLSLQRIYLRIMKKSRWIDERKFNIAME